MHWAALLTCILTVSLNQVSSLKTVSANYGETVTIPCDKGPLKAEDIMITKWKYDQGNILVKSANQNATVLDDVNYKTRVSMKEDFSLVITKVTMDDQRTFTCMVVFADILEFPVQLTIYKAPSPPQITKQATVMEIGKLAPVAECRTEGANPAANITWFKNKTPLVSDGTVVKISQTVDVDSVTKLSDTTSKLEYAAVKEDVNAKFTCRIQHARSADIESSPLNFTVNYPTEKVILQVLSQGPFKEGDNVTLKCTADGNPSPSSYKFYIKGQKKTVENSNTYTLKNITRADSGEYNCSLVDKEDMVDSAQITVDYLEVVLSSSGKIKKQVGESFEITLDIAASGTTQTSWRKGNAKLEKMPKFDKLKYSDSGVYEWVVSMGGLKKTQAFELIVEGSSVIKSLIKKKGDGTTTKVLRCEAEGFPKPTVQWSINGTNVDETAYVDGKITYSMTLVPKVNLTVSCTVSNALGSDMKSINVSTLADDVTMDKQDMKQEQSDQTTMVIGIVVGLLVAALAVGLAYWIYLKKFRHMENWREGGWISRGEQKAGRESKPKSRCVMLKKLFGDLLSTVPSIHWRRVCQGKICEKLKTAVMEGLSGWASYIFTTGQLINNACCKVCQLFALKIKAIKRAVCKKCSFMLFGVVFCCPLK